MTTDQLLDPAAAEPSPEFVDCPPIPFQPPYTGPYTVLASGQYLHGSCPPDLYCIESGTITFQVVTGCGWKFADDPIAFVDSEGRVLPHWPEDFGTPELAEDRKSFTILNKHVTSNSYHYRFNRVAYQLDPDPSINNHPPVGGGDAS